MERDHAQVSCSKFSKTVFVSQDACAQKESPGLDAAIVDCNTWHDKDLATKWMCMMRRRPKNAAYAEGCQMCRKKRGEVPWAECDVCV